MTETGSIDARFIRFRAWNGRKMRAQAHGDGHFLVSLGVELRWRRLPYIKFRSDVDEFWTAIILDGQFVLKPAKGEPIVLRSDCLRYRGWAEAPIVDRWMSSWSPETNLFEHTRICEEQAAELSITLPPVESDEDLRRKLY